MATLFKSPSISYSADPQYKAFVTFSGASGAILGNVLTACAPATGIIISQNVDVSAMKSLGNSLLLATFGDAPVSIVMDGLNLYTQPGGTKNGDTIADFYRKYKLSATAGIVDVGITGLQSGSAAFRCVITGLELKTTDTVVSEYGSYRMTLLGVSI